MPNPRFDLTTLRVFAAAAELRSIGKAVEREHIAVSAASKRVSDLEAALGTRLLHRLPRGVEPTPARSALLHHATVILRGLEQLEGDLGEYARGVKGHVRMMVNESSIVPSLPDGVSTDEITPTTVMLTHDERLGRYAHLGFEAGGALPIGVDAVRRGGFGVTVGGKRYGEGSSRESGPLAEKSAGIRLIIAENFERIHRQNCDNIGIFTSTGFGPIARIRAGETVPLEELLTDRDELTQAAIRAGGLLRCSKAHLAGVTPKRVATAAGL